MMDFYLLDKSKLYKNFHRVNSSFCVCVTSMENSANNTTSPPSVSAPGLWKMVPYEKYQGIETPIKSSFYQHGTRAVAHFSPD